MVHHITIEIEGESKPACVADYVTAPSSRP